VHLYTYWPRTLGWGLLLEVIKVADGDDDNAESLPDAGSEQSQRKSTP
jgi:hypothetical protein